MTVVVERPSILDGESIALLRMNIRGRVISPDDTDYDTARAVYNAMIDKRPALIVQCVDVADVMAAVAFAGDHDLPIAVRGGGHNAAGLGTCDDGLVIDLGRMNAVHVNPNSKRVLVEGGATWGDVDHATQPFGLAVPAGIIGTTGVGGLTLGGGFGYLSRKHGLTLDNLVAADMVLADGSFVTVSATERPDLFWAIRGGGGNFGVVTAFEFQAHEVGDVFAGILFYEVEKSKELMKLYREFIDGAPRELGLFFGSIFTQDLPFLPEEHQNKQMGKIVFCFNGSEADGLAAIEPFLAAGPSAQIAGIFPFSLWNSMFDAKFPAGRQDYWKADYITELTDEMIEIHLENAHKMPNGSSIMHIYSLNGAIQDVRPDATAYSHRDAKFVHVILMTDDDPDRMSTHIAFARAYWEALHPLSSGGGYVNMMMEEGEDRVKAVYRENFPQLQRIKAIYDPNNRFRINQNIAPKL